MQRFLLIIFTIFPSIVCADPNGNWQKPDEFQVPKSNWQVPGPINTPSGPWQVPKGIQAITIKDEDKCQSRLSIGSDTLFEFDQSTLNKGAEETLNALIPLILRNKPKKIVVEGHTDSKGGDDYNKKLSEARADVVTKWLQGHGFSDTSFSVVGLGEKRPIVSNTNVDGSDNPEGRQKNRRVEIVLSTCE